MDTSLPSAAKLLELHTDLLRELCEQHSRYAEELELHRQQIQCQEEKLLQLERRVSEPAMQGSRQTMPDEVAVDDNQDAKVNFEPAEETGEELTTEKLDITSYTINNSIWDASIAMGFDCINGMTALLIVIGILATTTVDACFILIVYANYSYDPFSDDMLRGLLHWRGIVAHRVDNADPTSFVTLASRVCATASSLSMSADQLSEYADFSDFRAPQIDALHKLNGHFLSIMALLAWMFSILEEVGMNFQFTSAVLARASRGASVREIGDHIRVTSFSMRQAMFVTLFVSFPRFVISAFLGHSGILFIAYTQNVGDLLLNAMALMFILDMDETFFHAILPQRVKNLMFMMEPLSCPGLGCGSSIRQIRSFFNGGLCSSLCRILFVAISLLLADIFLLRPFNDKMDTALHFLCGGKKTFIYGTNSVSNIVYFAPTPAFDAEQAFATSYVKKSVLGNIGLDPKRLEAVGYSTADQSIESINIDELTLDSLYTLESGGRDYASSIILCIDHMDRAFTDVFYAQSDYRTFQEALRDNVEWPSLENCSELEFEVCIDPSNSVPRALCARHCGCDNPWSGQYFASGFFGCPSSCDIRWELNAYYHPPKSIAEYTDLCLDVPSEVLAQQPFWHNYVNGVVWYVGNFINSKDVSKFKTRLEAAACDGLADFRHMYDLCAPGITHSLRLWCPETCQCAMSDLKECPRTCSYTQRYQLLAPWLSCPYGVGVSSEAECTRAAHAHFHKEILLDDDVESFNADAACWFNTANLFLRFSNKNLFSDDWVKVCRQAQPLYYDKRSLYHLDWAQEISECTLNDGKWDYDTWTCEFKGPSW